MPRKSPWIERRFTFDMPLSMFPNVLERLPGEAIARSAHHPRLNQPMRILDLIVFAAEHDDHHLARITEILRVIRARSS